MFVPGQGSQICLVVTSGADPGAVYRLGEGTHVVGRDPGCDVVLSDRKVSKRHAVITVGSRCTVADLESTNGTFRNGEPVAAGEPIEAGDVVSIGGVEVLVHAGTVAEGRPAISARPASRRGRTVLVAHAPADRVEANRLARLLSDAGHGVRLDRSAPGRSGSDGWSGRLLDHVWDCDGVILVISPATPSSARAQREVHVAAGERRPVLPVQVAQGGADEPLPDDLAWYLDLVPPVDLAADRVAGEAAVVAWVGGLRRRRINRPGALLSVGLGVVGTVAALAVVVVRIVLG